MKRTLGREHLTNGHALSTLHITHATCRCCFHHAMRSFYCHPMLTLACLPKQSPTHDFCPGAPCISQRVHIPRSKRHATIYIRSTLHTDKHKRTGPHCAQLRHSRSHDSTRAPRHTQRQPQAVGSRTPIAASRPCPPVITLISQAEHNLLNPRTPRLSRLRPASSASPAAVAAWLNINIIIRCVIRRVVR